MKLEQTKNTHLKEDKSTSPITNEPIKAFDNYFLNADIASVDLNGWNELTYGSFILSGVRKNFRKAHSEPELTELLDISLNYIELCTINDSIYQVHLNAGGVEQLNIGEYPFPKVYEGDFKSLISLYTEKYGAPKNTSKGKVFSVLWDYDEYKIEISSTTLSHLYYVALPGYERELTDFINKGNSNPLQRQELIDFNEFKSLESIIPGGYKSIDALSVNIIYTSKYFDLKVDKIEEKILRERLYEDSLKLQKFKEKI